MASTTRVVAADLRSPEAILGSAEVREFIDFARPVAVLLLAIPHRYRRAEKTWARPGRARYETRWRLGSAWPFPTFATQGRRTRNKQRLP